MPNNVAASMTASIVIDKSDLLAQILKGLSEGQKELENNKLEMYFDFSDSKNKAEFEKTLQKYKKQLASNDFVVKITNEGIEETVKSLDKLLDVVKSIASGKGFGTGTGSGNGIGNSIVDENQLKTVIDLFTKMESNLASIKKIFVDVGDGEEFSPLFSMINKINSSISELSSSVKDIGLNMNIDVGSDTELEAKIQSKMSNALQAYQRLFEHIKMSGVGGSMVNTNFFEFDINQFDTMMAKIQAYRKFIENMRNQVKSEFGGKDLLYTETDKKYWTSAASAMGQLTKAQNEMNKSADANPLDDLFGKTDLTGIIEQLNLIVSKLDEISVAATKFSETFSQGLNVTTSVEEVAKLTEKVKELETELVKVKSVSTGSTETNISSGMKDAFQGNTTASSAESTNAIQKENNALAETAENAEKAATSKKKFSQANEKVKETADESVSSIKDEANAFSQAEWDKNVKAIQDYMNVVSKLNNLKASDKGTGRKSNQIETQIKEVESLKDAAYEARQNLSSMINPHSVDIDTWEKFVQVMRQFSQASLGSAESVAKLEDALQNVKTSIVNSVQSSIDGYNKKLANLSATPADFNQSEKYKANLKELKKQISEFETFRDQIASKDTISEKDLQSINEYKMKIEDATRAITSMTAAEKGSTSLSRDKLYNKIGDYMKKNSGLSKQFRAELQKLQKQLTMRGANANVSDLTDEFLKLQIRIREAGEEGKKFWDVVKEKAWYGAASQIGMAFGVNDIIRYGQQIANTVIQLDTATTELRKVSDATDKRLVTNFENSAKTAKELGSTISDVISATADWSRMGYDIDQSEELARVSTLYKNVGDGIDIETANNSLISTLQGFQLDASEAESIIDKFNEVANNYAIDSAGIGEALQRSAASFNAANTDLSKSIALITATNEVVQDPDSVGTLWKTMSARIRGAETELSQLNEETDEYTKTTSKLRDLVKSLTGFDIMADEDTFKDIYDIILGIGKEWSNLTDAEQSSLGEALAGKRNANALYAVLGNLDTLQSAYETAENSAGSAQREQENYQKSIQYSIDQTKAKLEELSNDLLSSDFLKGAIDAGGKFIDILDGIVKSGNAIPAVFAGIGAALSFKNVGILELY